MDKELRKRLEVAAKEYQEEYETTERVAFTHGAVWGYKEAIARAKEWLLQHLPIPDWYSSTEEFVSDFETDMNKLWEDEK